MTVLGILHGNVRDLGGFSVSRVLPQAAMRSIGPFVFFDHLGPADFAPGAGIDVRPHPHIGLATVTYLFEGALGHRDSLGTVVDIEPGAVNWMTAGRGITHSERFDALRRAGGAMHGIQTWVALPTRDEEIDPAFAHHGPEDLPTYGSPDGLWARLIAGEAFGAKARVKTHSPMFYVHWRLQRGARAQIPAEYPERAAFVAAGSVEIDGRVIGAGQMAVFAPGEPVLVTGGADAAQAEIMLLGGESVGERFVEWNFVSSSQARIDQAKADWRAGRMKLPDLDHDEFIPLPDGPPPPVSPLS